MEEINLLSIISINEDNLKKNFNLLLNKIKEHDKLIFNLNQKMQLVDKRFNQRINQTRTQAYQYSDEQITSLKKLFDNKIDEFQKIHSQKLQQQCQKIQQRAKEDLAYKFSVLSQQISRQKQIMNEKVDNFTLTLGQQLYRKEDRTQVEKIGQQLLNFLQQQRNFEGQLKYVQHNVQKIMILEQKSLRDKQKREKQMIKQLQQKFTKQLKSRAQGSQKLTNLNPTASYGSRNFFGNPASQSSQSNIINMSGLQENQNDEKQIPNFKKETSVNQGNKQRYSKESLHSFKAIQDNNKQLISLKDVPVHEQKLFVENQPIRQSERKNQNGNGKQPQIEKLFENNSLNNNPAQLQNLLLCNKYSSFTPYDPENQVMSNRNSKILLDLIDSLETKIKQTNKKVNQIQRHNNQFRKQNDLLLKQNSQPIQNLKQKISEIKQETSKNDTKFIILGDKMSCIEKKVQDSKRQIQKISQQLKLNGFSKINQKIKQIQAQITTNFRDIRTKVQGKANQNQYDKHRQALEQRLTNLNQQILIKSDKIEVKKALVFLESKIKEIILVISNQENNEKQALLTKKNLKCMSCDREVDADKFVGNISFKKSNWDGLPLKDSQLQNAGRFAMTNFGTLAKKSKKSVNHSESRSTLPSIQQKQASNSICY